MTPEDYIAMCAPYAIAEHRAFGVPASIALAQGALESGWGGSTLCTQGHAHHGIKASKTSPGVADNPYSDGTIDKTTGEWFDGWTSVVATFLRYPDDAAGYMGHGFYLRHRGIYGAAFDAPDAAGFVRAVKAAGYATDPAYVDKILGIVDRYDLTQYDTNTTEGGGEMGKTLTPQQLIDALKGEGLKVREYPGWRDRCRCHSGSHEKGVGPTGRAWGPNFGTMVHITAGELGSRTVEQYIRDIINGDTTVPTKAHFVVEHDGTVWLNASGRANHAGTCSSRAMNALANGTLSLSGWQDLRGHDDDGNTYCYGIENIAGSKPSDAQYEASVRICAAISRAHGWDGRDAIGHGEASDKRSYSDPNLNMGKFRQDVMARVNAGPDTNTSTTSTGGTVELDSRIKRPDGHVGTVAQMLGNIDQRVEKIADVVYGQRGGIPKSGGVDGSTDLESEVAWNAANFQRITSALEKIGERLDAIEAKLDPPADEPPVVTDPGVLA